MARRVARGPGAGTARHEGALAHQVEPLDALGSLPRTVRQLVLRQRRVAVALHRRRWSLKTASPFSCRLGSSSVGTPALALPIGLRYGLHRYHLATRSPSGHGWFSIVRASLNRSEKRSWYS